MKILLVEDEEMLNSITAKYLRAEDMVVDTCLNGEEALETLSHSTYDVVVMDMMMPVMDGITALKKIREREITTPILLLTAKDTVQDKVNGLNAGADDYLAKPFEFEELIARIYALGRRSAGAVSNYLVVGPVTINVASRTVKVNGVDVTLTQKEFNLLYFLASNENVVVSRQQILDYVWDYDYAPASNLIDVYIKDLRKKIDASSDDKLIQTVRGVGYVFRVPEQH